MVDLKCKRNRIASMIIAVCILLSLTIGIASFNVVKASAQVSESAFLEMQSMIECTASEENVDLLGAEYIVDEVFYSNEQWAGYVIDFSADSIYGYAIFFYMDENYKLVEISFNEASAFYGKDGMFICPSLGYYIIKKGNNYYDAETMTVLTDYKPAEFPIYSAACGTGKREDYVKNIECKDFYSLSYEIKDFSCAYSSTVNTHEYNCANVAGVIMLNYWNKYYNNQLLKIDRDSLYPNGDMNGNTSVIYGNIFYDYMNTNWFFGVGGTIPTDGYKGFEKLIKEKGYKVERKTGLSYYEMRQSIDAGIPVFITCSTYYFADTLPDDQPDKKTLGYYNFTVNYIRHYGSAHTFVGFGYRYFNYHNKSDQLYYELFLKVADGDGAAKYFNFDMSKIKSSASIRVYK